MSGFVLLGVLFFAAGILAFAFKYYDNLEKRYKNRLSLVLCCLNFRAIFATVA